MVRFDFGVYGMIRTGHYEKIMGQNNSPQLSQKVNYKFHLLTIQVRDCSDLDIFNHK